jgi:outer membrane receptor protein involved in Fe transport
VGDAGTTEASGPSRRTGIEATAYFRPRSWLTLDADLATSRARFTNDDPSGRSIPGSVQTVISAGVSVDTPRGLFASARLRYFGPRPLVEDGSVRSNSTSLVNLQGGYRIFRNARVVADVFNLFDRTVSDIDYFYRSRLPGEPAAGIEDLHSHPALPRSVRVSLQVGF